MTIHRWCAEYGAADRGAVKRLEDLKKENARLKPLVAGELGPLVAREGAGRALAGIDVGTVDPLAQGGLGQVEVLGDLGDAAVADPAEADGLSLEGGH